MVLLVLMIMMIVDSVLSTLPECCCPCIQAVANNPWTVKLFGAFQDETYLYMVMEYLPGGDLLNFMLGQTLSEDQTRIYVAELIQAIDLIHQVLKQYTCHEVTSSPIEIFLSDLYSSCLTS